jgi:16S rRNA U516 pseudouridylate synthase RsuA-like enzyme
MSPKEKVRTEILLADRTVIRDESQALIDKQRELNKLDPTKDKAKYDKLKQLYDKDLEKIQSGITIEGHKVYVEEVTYIDGEAKSEIGVKMKTSNVKVVRNIFEHLKYNVIKLDRVVFAGLTKKNLPRGNWRVLTEQEVVNLKNN